jgi:CHAD domain-containing protein
MTAAAAPAPAGPGPATGRAATGAAATERAATGAAATEAAATEVAATEAAATEAEAAATEPAARHRHAHDFLAPALFALIAEVRRARDRVAATAGRGHDERDPEAIHDFRVALRRLRTVLRPARRVFGKRRLVEIGAELRRFAQATGTLRDEEVLRETLGALTLPPRAQAELSAWLVQRARQERVRRRAAVALLLAPDGPAGPSLGTALAHLERRLGRRRREDLAATDLAAATAAAALSDVRALATADRRDAAAMHALRIGFKRLRYAVELFTPILGEPAAGAARAAARMQKRLGELHDVDEALLRVARARGLSASAARAVHRGLVRARHEAARRVHRDLDEALGRVVSGLTAA